MQRFAALQSRPSRANLGAVPERAVLVGEQHQLAVAHACLAARIVQQHQREQAEDLGLIRHQLRE